MTTEQLILILVGVLVLAGMIHIPMVVLMVKSQWTLARVCGAANREGDRERRDLHDLIMRMLEKQGLPPVMAMQAHVNERLERQRLETSLQRDEMKEPAQQAPGMTPLNFRETPDGIMIDDPVLAQD